MKNPFYDAYRVLNKIYCEDAHLKIALAERLSDEEHRAATVKTVYGVLENDRYLSYCIQTFAPKNPKTAVRIVLKIALYHIIFLEKPVYMITDSAVELLKLLGKGGVSGFVNAFLHKFNLEQVVLPQGDEGLSIVSGYPLFLIKKLRDTYGDRTEAIVKAKSRGVCVRFVRGEEKYLNRPHVKTPFEHLYIFENFVRDEGFLAGDYTFQSVGSVGVCSVVEDCKNLLDACAAPGGKSVLLSSRCEQITANEYYAHRVKLIEDYKKRMGVSNVEAVQGDASVFNPAWEKQFDGVLCDVPCSGLGTVSENPDILLRKTEAGIEEIKKIQLAILQNCSRYVKDGGHLYYATCSILEEENDGVVGAFLKEHGEFYAEEADCPLSREKTRYGLQFLPDTAYGAGFYVCKLKRSAVEA